MDSSNNPWTGQETWDQDEEILLDPLATDEEMLLDSPTPMVRGRPQGDAPTTGYGEQRGVWQAPVEGEMKVPQTFRPQGDASTGYGEQRRVWQAPVEERYPRASEERERDLEAPVGAGRKRPKRGGMKRWKLLSIVLVGIVAISVVFGMLNRSGGFGAGATTSQSTPLPTSAPRPTSTPVSKGVTPVVPTNITSGALLLLNPAIVRQGTGTGVPGSGADPGATVDLAVKSRLSDIGQVVTFVHTDKNGLFTGTFTVPTTLSAGPFFIEARERG